MRRDYCDRCGADITDRASSSVQGIKEADLDGNGTITDGGAVCRKCYRLFRAWFNAVKVKA